MIVVERPDFAPEGKMSKGVVAGERFRAPRCGRLKK